MTIHTLIIARHGNTFAPDEAPRRVGLKTDLPLVESGKAQARKLGIYLRDHNLTPSRIFTSKLQRTRQTADLAKLEMSADIPVHASDLFNEIDYDIDENFTEDIVLKRLGQDALTAWDKDGVMPAEWRPRPKEIRQMWFDFASSLLANPGYDKTLVVTSNGIARFALHLTGDWDQAKQDFGLKLSTGAISVLTYNPDHKNWQVAGWNIRP